jgi:Na+-translocating ferredoxin:NAD+ oxidoreductase RNF subunit RnfB
MTERPHSIGIDAEKCIGCVACSQVCPTLAIRVRDDLARVNADLCIDCGECVRACRYDAARVKTSSSSDLKKFRYTVAIPDMTVYAQFGHDVHPGRVLDALKEAGFDSYYDMSWMCEMVGGATDALLSESKGPWPKVSATCPAIVRLIQIRYPDMIPNLVPIEVPRELAAKLLRRRLAAQLGLRPDEIGIFYITPCSAIINSIIDPVGMEESHLDGVFSVSELYGSLLRTIMSTEDVLFDDEISPRGMRWGMAGGEISGMRNVHTMMATGSRDVEYVFDRIEAGKFQSIDFIEAYICPDGCVGGQLAVENRFAARRTIERIVSRIGHGEQIKEERIRNLFGEHFFDLETDIAARAIRPLSTNLRQAIALKREQEKILEHLPMKDCAACGAPNCATLAEDIVREQATIEDCLFVRVERLEERLSSSKGGDDE